MGMFAEFGSWINQNNEEPRKAEDVESKSESETDNDNGHDKMKKYYDEEEMKRQVQLWIDAEKKHIWYDAPPKVKVTTKEGLCHMTIELTVGLPPDRVFEIITDSSNGSFFLEPPLTGKSKKVLTEDGPRQIAKVEKTLDWKFLGSSFAIPISLVVDENRKDLTSKYRKNRVLLMKVFKGSYKVEPLYVDSERLCKHMEPKSPEEYKSCSRGKGRIASKHLLSLVCRPKSQQEMGIFAGFGNWINQNDEEPRKAEPNRSENVESKSESETDNDRNQYFQPYPPFNLPPLSWYIRDVTIKKTVTALKTLQTWGINFRSPGLGTSTDKNGNVIRSLPKKEKEKKQTLKALRPIK